MAANTPKVTVETRTVPVSHENRQALKCETCDGCGKLDDLENKPWNRFNKQRDPRVAAGIIQPLTCPDCNGAGVTTQAALDAEAVATAAGEQSNVDASRLRSSGVLPRQAKDKK